MKKRKAISYQLIVANSAGMLGEQVNKRLKEGYDLHGDTFFISVHNLFCQAVKKSGTTDH